MILVRLNFSGGREKDLTSSTLTTSQKKNKPGGLKGRKMTPKVDLLYANEKDPGRSFVHLFKMYSHLCPKDRPKNTFYLQPLKNPSPECWFSNKHIGYNKLDGTVTRLCTLIKGCMHRAPCICSTVHIIV